jgi:hypothetical protein
MRIIFVALGDSLASMAFMTVPRRVMRARPLAARHAPPRGRVRAAL